MVEVWVTGDCDMLCPICFAVKKVGGYMTVETAEQVARFIRERGYPDVQFYGGEPLQNWPIVKLLISRLANVITLNITTNGRHLTQEVRDWFHLFNVGVALSFDGSEETQDTNRAKGSYGDIVANLDWLTTHRGHVLKTGVPAAKLHEDVKHIRDLGFRRVYINQLKPLSVPGYSDEDIQVYEEQYKRVIEELHSPPDFTVEDYEQYRDNPTTYGCGAGRSGMTIAPSGKLYPCIDAPLLGDDYSFGDVWNGINKGREESIRKKFSVKHDKCLTCDNNCMPCPVMFHLHGLMERGPEEWWCKAMKMRTQVARGYRQRGNFTVTPLATFKGMENRE